MARSLLRQLEQIRRSATYDDVVTNVYSSTVAEPTVSGSLEEDMNVVRTLMKELKGGTNWYDDLGNYFDPTDTTSVGVENKDLNLTSLKNNTLDAKTIIIAVTEDNSGANFPVSGTSTGGLTSLTTAYALPTNRTGLPIFASVANNGTYHDEGGSDNVCRIDMINAANDAEFDDGAGNTIYAKFHDGADFGGAGTGTDVFVRFYKNGSVCDLTGTGVTSVYFIYPQRKVMSTMEEYDWKRTEFVSSWEGDVELVEDISNLWSFTGASNDDGDAGPFTNETANYLLQSGPSDLKTALDLINDGVGNRMYTEDNYVVDGEGITTSLDSLDMALKDVEESVAAGTSEKFVEAVASTIFKNTVHALPAALVSAGGYTPFSTAGREGKNMDVYVGGQLLAADTGANGANADRDYGETTASGVTFRFNIQTDRNITYLVRQ